MKSIKKSIAYGGMAKAPMDVAKAPSKPMTKSTPSMPRAMPKGKTSIMKKGMNMGGMTKAYGGMAMGGMAKKGKY